MNFLVAAIILAETLAWDPVTKYEDGTDLRPQALSHYEVKNFLTPVSTVPATLNEIDVGRLPVGEYRWTVSVIGTDGQRSEESTPLPYVVAELVIPTATPKPTITPYVTRTPTPVPTPVRPIGVPNDWELKGIEYMWGPK